MPSPGLADCLRLPIHASRSAIGGKLTLALKSLRLSGSEPSLVGTWLSLVEHSLGVRGVGSSNLPVPTNSSPPTDFPRRMLHTADREHPKSSASESELKRSVRGGRVRRTSRSAVQICPSRPSLSPQLIFHRRMLHAADREHPKSSASASELKRSVRGGEFAERAVRQFKSARPGHTLSKARAAHCDPASC